MFSLIVIYVPVLYERSENLANLLANRITDTVLHTYYDIKIAIDTTNTIPTYQYMTLLLTFLLLSILVFL